MLKKSYSGMKKVLAISMAVLFVVSLTAVAVEAHGHGGHRGGDWGWGGGCGGGCGFGGFGGCGFGGCGFGGWGSGFGYGCGCGPYGYPVGLGMEWPFYPYYPPINIIV